jgi:asparagine synthase (glutamine-hydrolysing)
MCGIAGYYKWQASAGLLPSMLRSIAHRGPDADGEYRHPWHPAAGTGDTMVALGHRRLSIIDLSARSDQPFKKDGLVISYNGEVYNYRELAQELRASGVEFVTKSDTEVVLEAWRRWGPACLGRLRGMFAFALFEEPTRKLYLARDPFGIKPLFVFRRDGGLVFASEPKAILRATGSLDTDFAGIVASLLYAWVPERHCVYSGMRKLPPGHWAECRPNGEYRETRYFDPAASVANASRQPITVPELRQILEDSVAAHMIADVPVSTFLSGGLDSSLVTVLAARHVPQLDCYTITFRDEDRRFEAMPDDLSYAKLLARRHGLRLHEIEVAPELSSLLPEIVRVLDEPVGDAAAINTLLICSAARDAGVKVLLSGMGADEVFGGYRRHYANILAGQYRRLPHVLRAAVIEPIVNRLPVASAARGYRLARWARRFVQFASLEEEAAYRRSYTYYDEAELGGLLAPELWPLVDQLMDEHLQVYALGPVDDQVNRMCLTDVMMFLPGLNLAYSDRASMAASTELRVPLVDLEVIEAAFRVTGRQKVRGQQGKAILKQAAEAWLPREIIYRSKAAFGAPLRSWIRRDLVGLVDDLLLDNGLTSRGFLDRGTVERMIAEDRSGRRDHAQRIWHLLTLELWFRSQRETAPGDMANCIS